MIDYDHIETCQNCGCLFDFVTAIRLRKPEDDPRVQIAVCPACKHEFEIKIK